MHPANRFVSKRTDTFSPDRWKNLGFPLQNCRPRQEAGLRGHYSIGILKAREQEDVDRCT